MTDLAFAVNKENQSRFDLIKIQSRFDLITIKHSLILCQKLIFHSNCTAVNKPRCLVFGGRIFVSKYINQCKTKTRQNAKN